ncbi:DgyrCDS11048 [Dimorphilus gyrociliatus]|uniref:DgyrCDS11048 n=1 Tax=Dimorphilus gyrociliatus TaxID=2664684 RepID=A0A7I8W4N8_9ANNE|nr:DgyrCDS11048 [Dimorphilus gyrociliatus]
MNTDRKRNTQELKATWRRLWAEIYLTKREPADSGDTITANCKGALVITYKGEKELLQYINESVQTELKNLETEKKIHTDLIACKNMLEKQMEEANEEQIQMNNPVSEKMNKFENQAKFLRRNNKSIGQATKKFVRERYNQETLTVLIEIIDKALRAPHDPYVKLDNESETVINLSSIIQQHPENSSLFKLLPFDMH